MPHGYKTCKNCDKVTKGCRTLNCSHCGQSFQIHEKKEEKRAERAAEVVQEAEIKKAWTLPDGYDVPDGFILNACWVPSGNPPLHLRLEDGKIPSEETLYDWADNVRRHEIKKGWWITNHALNYWAVQELNGKYELDNNPLGPEVQRLKDIINGFPDRKTQSSENSAIKNG